MNSYSYAINNPLRYTDPYGETLWDVVTGQQSWGSYVVEIGQGAQTLYDTNPIVATAMDHPIGTGAFVGLSAGAGYSVPGMVYAGLGKLGLVGTGATTCASGGCEKAQVLVNQAQGLAGERAYGAIKNTQSILVNGRTRIPDILRTTQKLIGEIKTVKYQSLTSQIKDYMTFAQKNNFTFRLVVDKATKLSKPLQQAVDAGKIILERAKLK